MEGLRRTCRSEVTCGGLARPAESRHGGIAAGGRLEAEVIEIGRVSIEIVPIPLDARLGGCKGSVLIRRSRKKWAVACHLLGHHRSECREQNEDDDHDHDRLTGIVTFRQTSSEALVQMVENRATKTR